MSVLEIVALEKWWDATSGLRPVSLEADAGELVVVRGRSGSGKSTLLALVAGWCAPDGGSVVVLGETPTATTPWSTLAVVPQVLALVPELTVREMLDDAAREGRATGTIVDDLLDALAIRDVADRPPTDASMGQQQRAAIARALAGQPRLLLADEPTSHQDAGHVAAVVAALRQAADAGSAVLVATHDDTVAAAASRIVDLESS